MKIQKSRVFFSFPGKIYVFEVISPLDNFSREKAFFRSPAGSWQAAGCAPPERENGRFAIRLCHPPIAAPLPVEVPKSPPCCRKSLRRQPDEQSAALQISGFAGNQFLTCNRSLGTRYYARKIETSTAAFPSAILL